MQRIANEKAAVLRSRALPDNTADAMLNSRQSHLGVAKIYSPIHRYALNKEMSGAKKKSAVTAESISQALLRRHFIAAVAFQ